MVRDDKMVDEMINEWYLIWDWDEMVRRDDISYYISSTYSLIFLCSENLDGKSEINKNYKLGNWEMINEMRW